MVPVPLITMSNFGIWFGKNLNSGHTKSERRLKRMVFSLMDRYENAYAPSCKFLYADTARAALKKIHPYLKCLKTGLN